jgi:hypothetical protein
MVVSLYNKVMVGALTLAGVGALSSGAWAYSVVFSSQAVGSQINGQNPAVLTNVDSSGVNVTLAADPNGSVLTWGAPGDRDGIGINSTSYEDDEIEGCSEKLTITFSKQVKLSDVYLVDLFNEAKNNAPGTYLEQGSYQINGGSWVSFSADPSQTSSTGGYLNLDIDQMVTSIAFKAPGYTNLATQDHEFAVKGLSFSVPASSVPELDGRAAFGAVGLLFGGLMAGTSRRRKLSAKSGA